MALRRKTAYKKKLGLPRAKEETPILDRPAAVRYPRDGFRILMTVLLILAVCEILWRLHADSVPKVFNVKISAHIPGQGQPYGSFSAWGIASIGRDKIVLADTGNNRLLLFDRQGRFLKAWGKKGTGPLEFHEPSGMASDDKGNAYVMDCWNGAIKGFNPEGREVLNLPLGNRGFFGPRGLGFDGQHFLVVDTGNNRVVLLSRNGDIAGSWGQLGSKPGEMRAPAAVAADGKGGCFVADSGNHRCQWMNRDGKPLKIFPYDGEVPAVAVDKEGRFYVATTADDGCVKAYDPRGGYLGDLRDQDGFGDYFQGVRWMGVSPDDTLLVSDGTDAYTFQLPAAHR